MSVSGDITAEKLAGEAQLESVSGDVTMVAGDFDEAVLETVNSGEHVVAPRVMYHGTQDWLRRISGKRSIGLTLFDAADLDQLRGAIRAETTLVWIESPVNPTWDVIDIAAAAEIAHQAGAALVVDATVASPVTTRALEFGADIVFHSATKYLNGHSDVLAGILVSARDDERWREIKLVRTLTGGVLGPFEAWLLLRGMRTLYLRVAASSRGAQAVAEALVRHPSVTQVMYPGLADHPGHAIAARQMHGGFGPLVSFRVAGGEARVESPAAVDEGVVFQLPAELRSPS